MPQYFEYDENQKEDIREFDYFFGKERLRFRSDAGLFSAGHVDEGTDLLLRHIPPFSGSLLDLGCGWGAAGVTLGKAYGLGSITMSDINPKALALAQHNCAQNGVTAQLVLSDGFAALDGSYDVIALNPPIHAGKDVMFALYSGAAKRLNAGGALYVVILKKHGAQSTLKKLTEIFGSCEVLYQKKGCFVLRCVNQTAAP